MLQGEQETAVNKQKGWSDSRVVSGRCLSYKVREPNPALHLVLSGPAPCYYPAAAPSSRLIVKESLHLHSPKITFSPLKATVRLMWPPVKMGVALLLLDFFLKVQRDPGPKHHPAFRIPECVAEGTPGEPLGPNFVTTSYLYFRQIGLCKSQQF